MAADFCRDILHSKRKGLDFRGKRDSLRPHAGWLRTNADSSGYGSVPKRVLLRALKGWAFPACESVNFVRRRLGAAFARPVVTREVLSGVIYGRTRDGTISGKISSGFPSGIA